MVSFLRLFQITISSSIFLTLFSGCNPGARYDMVENTYVPFEATNTYNTGVSAVEVQRVAILPIYNEDIDGELIDNLDETFQKELVSQNLFEVVPVSRRQLKHFFKHFQFNSAEPLPNHFLDWAQDEFDAHAVLLVDLTHYNPYKPISVGVRSKLVSIEGGEILWAFDTLFDAGDPRVAVAARRFQLSHQKMGYPLDNGSSILRSPNRFAQYVAHDVFSTICHKKY